MDNHVKNKKYGNSVSISSLTGEYAAEKFKNFCNIECYWSRSHSLSATIVFLGPVASLLWAVPSISYVIAARPTPKSPKTAKRDCSRFTPFY